MKTLILKAHAKINLFLAVHNRRADGYHNLDSIMHTISLCDDVSVSLSPADTSQIIVSCSDSTIPCDESNTAHRAADAFMQASGLCLDVRIHIEKRIPSRAGLGGGSADAAAVLRGMNELCDLPFDIKQLCEIAATIGADVPFCISGGCAHATGIGEILSTCPPMSSELHIVAAMGAEGVSTPDAYRALANLRAKQDAPLYKDSSTLRASLFKGDTADMLNTMHNDFEQVVLHPGHDSTKIKQVMLDCQADGALLSGSGAAVFGIFTCPHKAENTQSILLGSGYFAKLARPV